jgi:hypothetical protein
MPISNDGRSLQATGFVQIGSVRDRAPERRFRT